MSPGVLELYGLQRWLSERGPQEPAGNAKSQTPGQPHRIRSSPSGAWANALYQALEGIRAHPAVRTTVHVLPPQAVLFCSGRAGGT